MSYFFLTSPAQEPPLGITDYRTEPGVFKVHPHLNPKYQPIPLPHVMVHTTIYPNFSHMGIPSISKTCHASTASFLLPPFFSGVQTLSPPPPAHLAFGHDIFLTTSGVAGQTFHFPSHLAETINPPHHCSSHYGHNSPLHPRVESGRVERDPTRSEIPSQQRAQWHLVLMGLSTEQTIHPYLWNDRGLVTLTWDFI